MADTSRPVGTNIDDGRDIVTSRPRLDRSRSSSQRARNAFNQLSLTRTETGESSKASSKLTSTPKQSTTEADFATPSPTGPDFLNVEKRHNGHVKESSRARRNRNSGGFLLSNGPLQPSSDTRDLRLSSAPMSRKENSPRDHKGKAPFRSQEQRHLRKKPGKGLGITASPLANNVMTVEPPTPPADEVGGDATAAGDGQAAVPSSTNRLDEESAQIVSLALNLSESRRVSKRNVSSPLPAPLPLGESFAGNSLRHHLQQQRRVSRNISPKPGFQRVGFSDRTSSPLRPGFPQHQDSEYRYHFTASTLARAEKAKTALELMAQYRELLQFLPPLKPQVPSRVSTAATSDPDRNPLATPGSPMSRVSTAQVQTLGRPYNPLQYIRNRKVRARERRAIDGESQGFGDVAAVSAWVQETAKLAGQDDYQSENHVFLPSFSTAADEGPGQLSPSRGKGATVMSQVKRPRIDWVIDPADMLADVFWLEQDHNKRLIEDRHGRKIFPRDLQRPESRRAEEQDLFETPQETPEVDVDVGLDTELPHFKSVKNDSEGQFEKFRGRTKQKLREATHFRHGHNGTAHEHHFWRSHSNSSTDSLGNDSAKNSSRHRRSATIDSQDLGTDILEKQMLEMLAKEARQSGWSAEGATTRNQAPLLDRKPHDWHGAISQAHSRQQSVDRHIENDSRHGDSLPTSGRASLEVPPMFSRRSLEKKEKETTTPSSPEVGGSKGTFFSFNGLDSPTHSRQSSPTRKPLQRVRSKLQTLRDLDRSRGRSRDGFRDSSVLIDNDGNNSAEHSDQVSSPSTQLRSRKTDDSHKSGKTGIRRKLGKNTTDIQELFKSSKSNIEDIVRSPVTKVGDLWRRRDSTSDSSSESEIEQPKRAEDSESVRRGSEPTPTIAIDDGESMNSKSYINDLPVFTSPFGRKSRNTIESEETTSPETDAATKRRQTRFDRLKPPRIDVYTASPSSSPELLPVDRTSDMSDIDSRRGSSLSRVTTTDRRLEDLLAYPGAIGRNTLPVTGLANLSGGHDRPKLAGKRQWSISDRAGSPQRKPANKREIARAQALLLSSGIKAKEISRRATETRELSESDRPLYMEVAMLTAEPLEPVRRSQEHVLSAQILSNDLQLSSKLWQDSADHFCNETAGQLLARIQVAQSRITNTLTPMTRRAADDADYMSRDIVSDKTLALKKLADSMDTMLRRRRRKFRWVRRAGWLLVEWALVGIMWWVWLVVVLLRVVRGVFRGVVGTVKWLLWLG